MKQKLMIFNVLLIISLLAGTAGAIEDAENIDTVSTSTTDLSVKLSCSGSGYFKEGDVVKITATFNKPVVSAVLTVEDSPDDPFFADMVKVSDTVWCCDYTVIGGIDDAVDVTVFGTDKDGKTVKKIGYNAFVIDNEAPKLKIVEPSSTYVTSKCVVFEFSAFDKLSSAIAYSICINGAPVKTGIVPSSGIVTCEIEKPDDYYQWEIILEDNAGNKCTSGLIDLYVDTKAPSLTLISPEDCFVDTTGLINFNFTTLDALSEKCELDLYYELYIDGALVEGCFGDIVPGECIDISDILLDDGAHSWSVLVMDKAGNSCTSEVRKFYVNCNGLDVKLVSPDGGFVPANPEFKFCVSGGPGLPFDYELFIDDEKVKCGTFIVGEDEINEYCVTAAVAEGLDKCWTVNIIDCAGRTCQPEEPLYFSVDCTAPAPVANLCVIDALSDTTWYYIYDEPGLCVSWDKNIEEDLHDDTPYVILISDCKPSCIEEMELAVPVSNIYESEDKKSLFMYIGKYGGKPLVYGKDYWVAVIAVDRAGNYDECFSMCGPVQTYEDMTITLDAGWNLKSVPKSLAKFNKDPCSVFGECSTVIYWDGKCWEFPETIEPCKGYWVYVPEASVSNAKFKPMSLDGTVPDVPPSLDLAPGWQMIGHTSTLPVHWSRTLGSLKGFLVDYQFSNLITYSCREGWGGTVSLGFIDLIDLVSEGESADIPCPVGILQADGFMVPGQGYWIFMKECGTYASIESVKVYPDGSINPDGNPDGNPDDNPVDEDDNPIIPDIDPIIPDIDPIIPDDNPVNPDEDDNPVDEGDNPVDEDDNPVDEDENPADQDDNPADEGEEPNNPE